MQKRRPPYITHSHKTATTNPLIANSLDKKAFLYTCCNMLYLFNGALWYCFQMKLRESFVAAEVRILAHAGNIVCIHKQL